MRGKRWLLARDSAAPALADLTLTSGSRRSLACTKGQVSTIFCGWCRIRLVAGGGEVIDELRDKLREARRRRDLAEDRVALDEGREFFFVHRAEEIAELLVDRVEPFGDQVAAFPGGKQLHGAGFHPLEVRRDELDLLRLGRRGFRVRRRDYARRR